MVGATQDGLPSVPKDRRGGFTMVEVVIAILLLSIGVLGLAGATGYLVQTVTLGDLMTERSAAFQTVIDRLQSLPYDNVTSGTTTVDVFDVSWNAVNDGPQSKILTVVTTGPGMSGNPPTQHPAVADTFMFRILRN
jgi:prepilin-type N-terminal cleavage/methylation domain-containing protein